MLQGMKVSHLFIIWNYFSYFLRSKIQLNLKLYEHLTFSLTLCPTEWSSAQVFFTYCNLGVPMIIWAGVSF